MTALDGAFAFAKMDAVAVLVAEDLDLDMAGAGEIFLDIDAAVTEGGFGFGGGGLECFLELIIGVDNPHPFPSATSGGFDQNRVADLFGGLSGGGEIGDIDVGTLHQREFGFDGGFARGEFVAQKANRFGAGADEDDSFFHASGGESFVFGNKAVAGVDSIGAGKFGGVDQRVMDKVALVGGGGADTDRFVGHADMKGSFVRLGVDGDGADAEVAAGADNSDSYLPSVGYQYFANGLGHLFGIPRLVSRRGYGER